MLGLYCGPLKLVGGEGNKSELFYALICNAFSVPEVGNELKPYNFVEACSGKSFRNDLIKWALFVRLKNLSKHEEESDFEKGNESDDESDDEF